MVHPPNWTRTLRPQAEQHAEAIRAVVREATAGPAGAAASARQAAAQTMDDGDGDGGPSQFGALAHEYPSNDFDDEQLDEIV